MGLRIVSPQQTTAAVPKSINTSQPTQMGRPLPFRPQGPIYNNSSRNPIAAGKLGIVTEVE